MTIDTSIFDILLEPCLILNKESRVVYCNETAAILFGISVRKIIRISYKFHDLIQLSEEIDWFINLENITSATPIKEVSFKTLINSGEGKIQLSIQPFNGSNTSAVENLWIMFIRDVTLEERLQKKYQGELEQKQDIIDDLKEAQKMLQDYSKNLENKVNERTLELSSLNQTMKTLLDSLHQGFFIFNKEGVCLPVYSEACISILESKPAGKQLVEVLNIADSEKQKIKDWVDILFEQIIPFEDAILFGPNSFNHSKSKIIELSYYPIMDQGQKLTGVVAVATDITSLVEARKEAELEKSHAKLVLNIVRNRKQIQNFITDCKDIITHLNEEFEKPEISRNPADLFRFLHTLKGGASSFSITDLTEHCHLAESVLTDIRDQKEGESYFKEKWKSLVQLVKQIELDFNGFLNYTEQLIGKSLSQERTLEISFSQFVEVIHRSEQFFNSDNVKQVLTEEFLMEPVEEQIKIYQETIDKLAMNLGKKLLPINIRGGHIKVLPEFYKTLFSTFIHVVRNILDHGIETPEKRIENGKSDSGQIIFSFELINEILKIQIIDDGIGIDPSVIRSKLLEKGIDTTTESDEQVIQHIFDPGFSTKKEVSSISGRGVGMDAVLYAVQSINGKIFVQSKFTQGTQLNIEVPYCKKIPHSKLNYQQVAS